MSERMALTADEGGIALELPPEGRTSRLREMFWNRTHCRAVSRKPVAGCGEDTLTGHARDFAVLLEASDPFIQPDELIVGCCLAYPEDPSRLNLGYYNSHYPPGHRTVLQMGLPGIHDHARTRLDAETDPAKRDFLQGVEIAYDAACRYVARYAQYAAELAAAEADPGRRLELEGIAAVCRELSVGAPTSFQAALQLLQFTRLFGGSGCIGRFDQWMHPFYRRDVDSGRLSQAQAQELLECLFVKLNYFGGMDEPLSKRGAPNDDLRNIALAGQTPAGEDAANDLTYMCLRASARLMLPEPKLNVRFFPGTPRRLLRECCRVLAKGANILAIFNDEVAIPALERLGIPREDARDYCNDGCSELIVGGRSTIRFREYDSLAALRETVLRARQRPYESFSEVMADLKERLAAFIVDERGVAADVTFPYFAAGIEDCLAQASPSAARYRIWGSILTEVGNTADGLAAIRKLIFEQHALSWDGLLAALEAGYEGHEPLRQMLLHRAPKYGNDSDEVDALAREIAEYYCDRIHERAANPPGPGCKWAAGLMSFDLQGKRNLPASADGRRQGDPTANSFSPCPGRDRSGPTAVVKSAAKADLSKASHGSVLDIALHSSVVRSEGDLAKLASLVDSFLRMPATATLQMNVIDRDTLLRARANPQAPEYRTLLVRVWGFSAVFVELPPALQDHVLQRTEHRI